MKLHLSIAGLLLALVSFHSWSKDPLPLDTVLDEHGNPIAIPKQQSALEMPAPATPSPEAPRNKSNEKQVSDKAKKPRKLSRKQQLANRTSVANDPFCRWLDQRLKQLEKAGTQKYGHHAQERKVRMQEWQCLKCGAEGPATGDHHKCQAR
ncbi:hypothetical protein L2750_16935 [Shewanella submarina]|uniref:Uncharacterized protein n=1 Tax=Shewanella submarina TaxID=2016376 RepID=A0ABV7GGA4_9GAMM|nr:hypothetical protein [Shewanella submarina]MCL1038816.1 hypothetical protein [Shewanella submarina]